jgi:adenine-specific DNA-methyltransferase
MTGHTRKAKYELKKLFPEVPVTSLFTTPKPTLLIKYLLKLGSNRDSLILDFFSGSSTTADAVMQLNAEDAGKRKYIMIQVQELSDEVVNNKYTNICEMAKERIRRASDKIQRELAETNSQLKLGEEPKMLPDIGFKVFRTADTNIKWNLIESEGQMDTEAMTHTPDLADFTFGFNDIDVVYEIMLRQKDIPLSEKLEVLSDIGARTYLYGSAYLICLETEITLDIVNQLASLNPLPIKFVFRDSAFKDDINMKDDTFRRLKNLIDRNSGANKNTYTVEFI